MRGRSATGIIFNMNSDVLYCTLQSATLPLNNGFDLNGTSSLECGRGPPLLDVKMNDSQTFRSLPRGFHPLSSGSRIGKQYITQEKNKRKKTNTTNWLAVIHAMRCGPQCASGPVFVAPGEQIPGTDTQTDLHCLQSVCLYFR